jgi:hypothetical protein
MPSTLYGIRQRLPQYLAPAARASALAALAARRNTVYVYRVALLRLTSIYPKAEVRDVFERGERLAWTVPPRTALVLEASPR